MHIPDAKFQNIFSVMAFGASSLFLLGVRWGRMAMHLLRMKALSPQPCLQKPFHHLNIPVWKQLCYSSRELAFLTAEVTVGFMMVGMATVSSVTQIRPSPSACSRQRAEGSHRDPKVSYWSLQMSHCNWRSSAWWMFHFKKMIWKLPSYHNLR